MKNLLITTAVMLTAATAGAADTLIERVSPTGEVFVTFTLPDGNLLDVTDQKVAAGDYKVGTVELGGQLYAVMERSSVAGPTYMIPVAEVAG